MMTSTRLDTDEANITKIKKYGIYSEFHCFKRSEDYLVSNIHRSTLRELGPKLWDNKIIKAVNDERPSTPTEDGVINMYQKNKKLQPQAKIMNPCLCKTRTNRERSYGTDIKHTCTDNCYFGYFDTDISRLLHDMDYTYNTVQSIMQGVKPCKRECASEFSSILLLVIDSHRIDKFFEIERLKKFIKMKKEQYHLGGDQDPTIQSTYLKDAFDVTSPQQCIGLKLLLCKYLLSNIMETITFVCNYFLNNQHRRASLVSFRNWSFINIIQGYILSIILRMANKNNLYVLTKQHIVLITDAALNTIAQVECVIKNGKFLEDANLFSRYYMTEDNETNKDQRIAVRKSSVLQILYVYYIFVLKSVRLLNNAICYDTPMTHDNFMEQEEFSDSGGIDDATITLSNAASVNIIRSDFTINITINKSAATSFIFTIEDITGPCKELKTKSVSTLCNTELENDNHMSIFGYSKLLLKKLVNSSKTLSACLNLKQEELITETIFEDTETSADSYVKIVHNYLKRFTCQTFCTDLFTCLTQAVVNMFFSFRL
ncbi:uncharacterized protein LOC113492662 [Trichoplusia ni]|uniref:Uncharacterized protein LOC113492662 n=1 Tax=Trichoplusia ni TaxID=7111 RepID=A0A7E5VCN5_TRINI|nr:uncharacterized protein LOC113492662 [Trichoplusia ni]XP_026726052.1 uncharacterized protein LOC113492662 [Trichoplusia ni]